MHITLTDLSCHVISRVTDSPFPMSLTLHLVQLSLYFSFLSPRLFFILSLFIYFVMIVLCSWFMLRNFRLTFSTYSCNVFLYLRRGRRITSSPLLDILSARKNNKKNCECGSFPDSTGPGNRRRWLVGHLKAKESLAGTPHVWANQRSRHFTY